MGIGCLPVWNSSTDAYIFLHVKAEPQTPGWEHICLSDLKPYLTASTFPPALGKQLQDGGEGREFLTLPRALGPSLGISASSQWASRAR